MSINIHIVRVNKWNLPEFQNEAFFPTAKGPAGVDYVVLALIETRRSK